MLVIEGVEQPQCSLSGPRCCHRQIPLALVAVAAEVAHAANVHERNAEAAADQRLGAFAADGDPSFNQEAVELAGHASSYLEHAAWERAAREEAISAVKALRIAHEDPGNTIEHLKPGARWVKSCCRM